VRSPYNIPDFGMIDKQPCLQLLDGDDRNYGCSQPLASLRGGDFASSLGVVMIVGVPVNEYQVEAGFLARKRSQLGSNRATIVSGGFRSPRQLPL
jgi:hypothetical protein